MRQPSSVFKKKRVIGIHPSTIAKPADAAVVLSRGKSRCCQSVMSWNVSYGASVYALDCGATVPLPLLPSLKGAGLGDADNCWKPVSILESIPQRGH
jgi:hypothetical protein